MGKITHGGSRTPEYQAWRNMIKRCYTPSHAHFKHYGGRGIMVCIRWLNGFAAFLADVGSRPSPTHSLDRKNNNGHYTPRNVRWASPIEQRANRRPCDTVPKNPAKGEGHGCAKLTNKEVLEIRAAYVPWRMSCRMLAEKYNVDASLVGLIVARKIWRHI